MEKCLHTDTEQMPVNEQLAGKIQYLIFSPYNIHALQHPIQYGSKYIVLNSGVLVHKVNFSTSCT